MLDEDGNHISADQAVFVALAAYRDQAVVIRRSDDTPMTTLRIRVRRAAKALNVAIQVRILSDNRMSVLAIDRTPDLSVQHAMDEHHGI